MKRIAVTGSSGLIGTAVVAALTQRGDEVVRFVRRPARGRDEVQWDLDEPNPGPARPRRRRRRRAPRRGRSRRQGLLQYKREILSSRTDTTHALATAIAQVQHPGRASSRGRLWGTTATAVTNRSPRAARRARGSSPMSSSRGRPARLPRWMPGRPSRWPAPASSWPVRAARWNGRRSLPGSGWPGRSAPGAVLAVDHAGRRGRRTAAPARPR